MQRWPGCIRQVGSASWEIGSSGWRRTNEAKAYLTKLECQLQHAGVPVETALVTSTRSTGDEAVCYAAANGHDLIAMASDSRPWYRRLLRSAQDDDVLRKATVPTLFIGDGKRRLPAERDISANNRVMAALGSADL